MKNRRTKRPIVFATQPLGAKAEQFLRLRSDFSLHDADVPMQRHALLAQIEKADGVIASVTDRVDAEFFERAPHLKVVGNFAVGFDNIDVDEATRRSIVVAHTPHVLSRTVAELTWALMLSVTRRIVEADRFTRNGKFQGWSSGLFVGTDLSDKTLGIVGMGRIGVEVAKLSRGFDMKVLYYNRRRRFDEDELGARYAPLPDLLKESDVVVVLLPYTAETHYIIDADEISLMKPTAILVNVGRGKVVNDGAVIQALKEGRLWGAGFDVYENEPEVPGELIEMDNVVLLPHIGNASQATRDAMAMAVAQDVLAVLSGKEPRSVINPEVFSLSHPGDE